MIILYLFSFFFIPITINLNNCHLLQKYCGKRMLGHIWLWSAFPRMLCSNITYIYSTLLVLLPGDCLSVCQTIFYVKQYLLSVVLLYFCENAQRRLLFICVCSCSFCVTSSLDVLKQGLARICTSWPWHSQNSFNMTTGNLTLCFVYVL